MLTVIAAAGADTLLAGAGNFRQARLRKVIDEMWRPAKVSQRISCRIRRLKAVLIWMAQQAGEARWVCRGGIMGAVCAELLSRARSKARLLDCTTMYDVERADLAR